MTNSNSLFPITKFAFQAFALLIYIINSIYLAAYCIQKPDRAVLFSLSNLVVVLVYSRICWLNYKHNKPKDFWYHDLFTCTILLYIFENLWLLAGINILIYAGFILYRKMGVKQNNACEY